MTSKQIFKSAGCECHWGPLRYHVRGVHVVTVWFNTTENQLALYESSASESAEDEYQTSQCHVVVLPLARRVSR